MSHEPAAELRKLTVEDLQQKLANARADLLTAQKSLKANELANPHAVTKLRREVARILTVMSEVIATEAKQSSDNSSVIARSAKGATKQSSDNTGSPRATSGARDDSSESDDTKHQKGAK